MTPLHPDRQNRLRAALAAGSIVFGAALPDWASAAQPMDPSSFPNDSCKECHTPAGRPPVDLSKPECAECHTVTDDGAPRNIADGPSPVSAAHPGPMVPVPAGEFIMGNDGRGLAEGSGDEDEQPRRVVYTDAFWIDRFEVTNAQYKAFIDAGKRRAPKHWTSASGGAGGNYPPGQADHPVVYVDWFDANAYCHWAGKRLPTEEEWEKAARGADGRVFPWGNAFDPKKANSPQYWLSERKEGGTLPVGRFPSGVGPYGAYDLSGNVYEWVANWYKPYPGNHIPNGHYGEKNKIVRGGSWYDCLSYGCGLSAPGYNRSRFAPEIRNKGFGFRCAKSD